MMDKILYSILAFTLGFVIVFCTLVINKKDDQIRDLKNKYQTERELNWALFKQLSENKPWE